MKSDCNYLQLAKRKIQDTLSKQLPTNKVKIYSDDEREFIRLLKNTLVVWTVLKILLFKYI